MWESFWSLLPHPYLPSSPPAAGTPGGDKHRHVGHPWALVLAALESLRLPFAIPSSLDRTGPAAELGFRGTGDARRRARVSGAPLSGLVALFLATHSPRAWQGPGLRPIPGAEEAAERRAWHCGVQGAPGV